MSLRNVSNETYLRTLDTWAKEHFYPIVEWPGNTAQKLASPLKDHNEIDWLLCFFYFNGLSADQAIRLVVQRGFIRRPRNVSIINSFVRRCKEYERVRSTGGTRTSFDNVRFFSMHRRKIITVRELHETEDAYNY